MPMRADIRERIQSGCLTQVTLEVWRLRPMPVPFPANIARVHQIAALWHTSIFNVFLIMTNW